MSNRSYCNPKLSRLDVFGEAKATCIDSLLPKAMHYLKHQVTLGKYRALAIK